MRKTLSFVLLFSIIIFTVFADGTGIEIWTEKPGVLIFVNGSYQTQTQFNPIINTSNARISLPPGSYRIRLEHPDYKTEEFSMMVPQFGFAVDKHSFIQDMRVQYSVKETSSIVRSGTLNIRSNPVGATIRLDGVVIQNSNPNPKNILTDASLQNIPIGQHEIELTLGPGNSLKTSFTMYEDALITVNADFQTQKIAISGKYVIQISTTPDNAQITIDGQNYGNSAIKQYLSDGLHTVILEKDGYEPQRLDLNITKNSAYSFDLQKKPVSYIDPDEPIIPDNYIKYLETDFADQKLAVSYFNDSAKARALSIVDEIEKYQEAFTLPATPVPAIEYVKRIVDLEKLLGKYASIYAETSEHALKRITGIYNLEIERRIASEHPFPWETDLEFKERVTKKLQPVHDMMQKDISRYSELLVREQNANISRLRTDLDNLIGQFSDEVYTMPAASFKTTISDFNKGTKAWHVAVVSLDTKIPFTHDFDYSIAGSQNIEEKYYGFFTPLTEGNLEASLQYKFEFYAGKNQVLAVAKAIVIMNKNTGEVIAESLVSKPMYYLDADDPTRLLAIVNSGTANFISKAVLNNALIPMAYVKGGTFVMGSNTGARIARPSHTVKLDSFYIGLTEVTQAQYLSVVGTNPSQFSKEKDYELLPVEQVNWFDAVNFCNLLSKKEGLEPVYTVKNTQVSADFSKNGYRLPTEAEWEYAARSAGVDQFRYAGSNDPSEVAWYSSNAIATNYVGKKNPNQIGLFDMSGNVWEWCWDWFAEGYYPGSETNPVGPAAGDYRVMRGGSWYRGTDMLDLTLRNCSDPKTKYSSVGFRVVRKP